MLAWASSLHLLVLALYQIAILFSLGFNRSGDIYYAAVAIPGFLNALIYSALTFSILPNIARQNGGRDAKLAASLVPTLTVVILLFYLLFWGLNKILVSVIFPGFSSEATELYLATSSVTFGSGAFVAIGMVATMVAQSRTLFTQIEFMNLVLLVFFLSVILLSSDEASPLQIAYIDIFRTFVLACGLILVIRIPLKDIRIDFSLLLGSSRGAGALLTGNVLLKASSVLDRSLATFGTSGELTLMHVVQQLYLGINKLFSKIRIIPSLATGRFSGDIASQKRYYKRTAKFSLYFAFGCYAALIGSSVLLVEASSATDLFDDFKPELLLYFVLAAAGLFLGGILGQVAASYFYSAGDTKTPMQVSIVNALIAIIARFIGASYFGVVGLLLAAGLHQVLNLIVLDRMALSRMES